MKKTTMMCIIGSGIWILTACNGMVQTVDPSSSKNASSNQTATTADDHPENDSTKVDDNLPQQSGTDETHPEDSTHVSGHDGGSHEGTEHSGTDDNGTTDTGDDHGGNGNGNDDGSGHH